MLAVLAGFAELVGLMVLAVLACAGREERS